MLALNPLSDPNNTDGSPSSLQVAAEIPKPLLSVLCKTSDLLQSMFYDDYVGRAWLLCKIFPCIVRFPLPCWARTGSCVCLGTVNESYTLSSTLISPKTTYLWEPCTVAPGFYEGCYSSTAVYYWGLGNFFYILYGRRTDPGLFASLWGRPV